MNIVPDIPGFLDRRSLIWTYTMLSTYKNICAHQAYRRYVLKKGDDGHIPYVETDAMRKGNVVHAAMEARVAGQKPLPPDMHAYDRFAAVLDGRNPSCELRLGVTKDGKPCDFFAKDVWGRGKADAAVVDGDRAYLADWKTGKVREDPFELEVQAVLLKARWPNLQRIVGQYVWLSEMRTGEIHDLSDVNTTWRTICDLVRSMEEARRTDNWPKEPGKLCGWCDVMDCEHNTKRS